MIHQLMYLDPGSGSLLFQALLSGMLTVLVFFKKIVQFVRLSFSRKKNPDNLLVNDREE